MELTCGMSEMEFATLRTLLRAKPHVDANTIAIYETSLKNGAKARMCPLKRLTDDISQVVYNMPKSEYVQKNWNFSETY